MGLSRLSNFIKSIRGNVLYVDPNSLDSTDSIENQGNSLTQPFKTIQRALLEASRFSYQRGFDNDRFEKTSIIIYPGEHLIDNRPGWIPDGIEPLDPSLRRFLLRSGLSSNNLFEFDGVTNFNLETDENELYKLNSIHGGVIIPRGVSLVGMDLRKTKIRPKYVPNPENDNIERSAIFRLTGGSFFWNFTIFDANASGQVYQDYTLNKRLPNFSHNKLTVFEYADGKNPVSISDEFLEYLSDKTDLDMYYEKISIIYGISSGRSIDPTFPESGLDIQAINGEFEIVGSKGENFIISNIFSGNGTVSSDIITVQLNRPIIGLNVNTPIRIQGIPTPGYNGSYVILEVVDSVTIRYRSTIAPPIPSPNISGFTPILDVVVDTVNSSSPYIFNVSLRSVYGMCGIHADGDKADGFKSIVVAQFTGIGIQKDNNAFLKFNRNTGIYEDSTIVPNLSSDSRSIFKPKYENFHIKASNDAFMQLVSVFAIGFAKQFIVESGGDFSVTNSNSNFGSKALSASGFKRQAFSQDDVGYITHIIPPRQIENESITLTFNSIDINKTIDSNDPSRLYLYNETNFNNPPENIIDGYRIGTKKGETLSVIISKNGVSEIKTSEIIMQVPPSLVGIVSVTSYKVYSVALDSFNLPNIDSQTNIITLQTPHGLQNGEKIRVLSSVAFLPNGIESNQIYFAITVDPQDPFALNSNQIKLAKTINDAISNISININNNGQFLRIESRVSDKLTGEIGHPIQWDDSISNWYITVNSANNQIYDSLLTLSGEDISDSTSRTFFERTSDDRNLIDTVYRYRYIIPKDSPITARSPVDSFVIQESNSSIGLSNTEIQKYFDINKLSEISELNPYQLKNFRLIASAIWSNGIATITTELPHDLVVLSEVELNNIISTQNTQGLKNRGFNGKFTVINVSDRKTFSIEIPIDPGLFLNQTKVRDINLPFFKRTRYRDTYSLYKKEEIQEYIPGQRDGIYHLFLVTNSISPFVDPFNSLKLSQPIENFYPQKNRDNPKSNVDFSISFALPDPIGKVIVNDVENSITSESVGRFTSDASIGFDIDDIQSNPNGIQHTIYTKIDHGLNRITEVSLNFSGLGYGSGDGPETEIFYNAQLVGSSTGEGATAVVKVQNSQIIDILLMDGGSGYQVDEVLSVVGIATTTGFIPSLVSVDKVYNDIDTNFRIEGIFIPPFNAYNGVYRITGVPNSRRIEVSSDTVKVADLPSIGELPIIQVNPLGLKNIDPLILQFAICATSGRAIEITQYSYDSATGFAIITTENSNGVKIDTSIIITGFDFISENSFNGQFFVKKIISVTQFEIFVGIGLGDSPNVVEGQQYINRPGFGASGGSITLENEETSGRLSPRYGNLTTTLASTINDSIEEISLNNFDNLDFKIGDYIIIDYEIMRIREDVSNNPIKVFRGLLGTTKKSHIANSYIERIKVFPIEFRRNSVIRASGHTFEYVGYGPGNYSTTLPERQDRILSKAEETLSQSFKTDGGVIVYTGMNDQGNFYIGNRRVISTTGREEVFDSPVPTVTGEDPTGSGNFGFNLISPDEVRVERSIKVEGGGNNNIISEFDGPVVFNNKITTLGSIESNSLNLKGNSNVSRNYTVGVSTPVTSANPGDVVFDEDPESGSDVGWVYTLSNKWEKFGPIQNNGFYNGNFSGTFIGDASGLTGVSDIWTLDDNGIFYGGNVGMATNKSLPNFALHIFGGIKADGISEFNSQQLTFNVPSLLNFNATDTRVNQSLSVIGVSTFSNNIFIRTTEDNTNGRNIRFIQADTSISDTQGYGGIEWEGFDTGNSGLRGYIRGISEGSQGEFSISFATQGLDASNPIEALRINSSGICEFKNEIIGEQGFIGNLTGNALSATNATLIRVNPDATDTDRYITFVGGVTDSFYNQRSSNNFKYNPFTNTLQTLNIFALGNVGIGTNNPGEKLQVDGNIRVGNSPFGNYIAFLGTYADGTNASGDGDQSGAWKRWEHTYIGERIYDYSASGNAERSELLIFKGNDTSTDFGPDRVRVLSGEFRVDIHTGGLAGTFEQVGSSALVNTRLIVTSTGNIGVGIENPTSKLQVAGSITPSQNKQFDLGSSSLKWKTIHTNSLISEGDIIAPNFRGNLVGNITGTVIDFVDAQFENLSINKCLKIANDKFSICYESNYSNVLDSEGKPFTSEDAIIIRDNTKGPIIFEAAGTGPGGFIFKSQNSNKVIARFHDTTNSSIGTKSIRLYHKGDEIFTLDGKGIQVQRGAYISDDVGIGIQNPTSKLQVAGDITPSATNVYSLGTQNLKWKTIHTNGLISTGDITAPTFRGKFVGSITLTGNNTIIGNVNASSSDLIKTVIRTTNANHFLTFVNSNNSSATNENLYTSTNIRFNPSTGNLTAIKFIGNLSGNVTGNVTGNLTGNAKTATTANTANTATTASNLTRTVVPGNGLISSGSLNGGNVTLSMRTPLNITDISTNTAGTNTTGHTHRLDNGAVTTPKIANGAVTADKLSSEIYGIRAWAVVQANGAISRKSPNVKNVENPSPGRYKVNFTKALPTSSYAVTVSPYTDVDSFFSVTSRTTTSVSFSCIDPRFGNMISSGNQTYRNSNSAPSYQNNAFAFQLVY